MIFYLCKFNFILIKTCHFLGEHETTFCPCHLVNSFANNVCRKLTLSMDSNRFVVNNQEEFQMRIIFSHLDKGCGFASSSKCHNFNQIFSLLIQRVLDDSLLLCCWNFTWDGFFKAKVHEGLLSLIQRWIWRFSNPSP